MLSYLVRRALVAAGLLLSVVTITFLLIHAAPGDPADLYTTKEMDPVARARVLAAYGLDRPLTTQYVRWLSGLARGDLGWSISHQRPVATVLAETIPRTIALALPAFALHLAIGLTVGLIAAWRRGTLWDLIASGGSLIVYAVPSFWLGAMLILFFAIQLEWLPSSGLHDITAAPRSMWAELADRVRHMILPVACLGLGSAAYTARFVRGGLIDALGQEYALAARARGAARGTVLMRHALRNVIPAIITLSGMSLPFLLSGSVLVENVFSWPGIGKLSVEAVFARDYPVVLATQLLLAGAVVAGNFLADAGLAAADPRLRKTR